MGEILVEPKSSVLAHQNTISTNWEENGREKGANVFEQKCPHHKLLSPLCCVYTFVFVFFFF